MSTRNKFEAQLKLVFDKLLRMCRQVEAAIEKSVEALRSGDEAAAREVVSSDRVIDDAEREIESDCLKILLMEHPVATDFRDVSAALKMITDMERIGDQAEDIAEIIPFLRGRQTENSAPMREMAEAAMKMVTQSVDAFVKRDIMLAERVV